MVATKKFSIGMFVILLLCAPLAMAATHEVDQQDKQFTQKNVKIERLKIKKGDTVNFKNLDPWFHNVFSLSDIKTFDLGSYPKGEYKSVVFDVSGTAEIECAIHPHMHLTVEVQ